MSDRELERGRQSYTAWAWRDAHELLTRADGSGPLASADLELLATSAYMLGREDEYLDLLERAHQAHLNAGDLLPAANCALWLGMTLAQKGEMARAGGWLARAHRLIEREGRDCVERGYLLMPQVFEREATGDLEGAIAAATEAAEVAERFDDRDLFALATHSRGHLLAAHGRPEEGLGLLDEAMVAVSTGELSPIASGIVYCGVILGCQAAHELRRAKEWTAALSEWCEQQPDMVAFTGRCLVHRAEVLRLQGSWDAALQEARRAGQRCIEGENRRAAGEAAYLEGELHRLQGRFDAAEQAYLRAHGLGRDPQPGRVLLRLAEGNPEAALAGIRRAGDEGGDRESRVNLLPAVVEVSLAVGEVEAAGDACAELEAIAVVYRGGALEAIVAQVSAAVALALDDSKGALNAARRAAAAWQDLDAPYETARARVLIGRACEALGDGDAAAMELAAARDGFAHLGAGPDVARTDELGTQPDSRDEHGLTPRELEVVRLVAAGRSNRDIAGELVLSERTVERHLSNVFARLGVSSRSAVTAFAYEHRLV